MDNTTRVFRISGRRYAVGLTWDLAQETSKTRRDLLTEARGRRTADAHTTSLVVLRPPVQERKVGQIAFATDTTSARGAISAAAVAANRIKGSWLAAVEIGTQGFWLVQVEQDQVVADEFFESVSHAQDAFRRSLKGRSLPRVYAPATWASPRDKFEVFDLTSVLGNDRGPQVVRLTGLGDSIKIIGGVIVAVAVLGVAGGTYLHHRAEVKREQQEEQDRLARMALQQKLAREHQTIRVEGPWRKMQTSGGVIDACEQALPTIPHVLPGYTTSFILCNPEALQVSAEFRREFGTPGWTEAWFDRHYKRPVTLSILGNENIYGVEAPLQQAPLQGSQALFSADQVRKAFFDRQFLLNATMTLGDTKFDRVRVPVKGQGTQDGPVLPWGTIHYSIQADVREPWENLIRKIPGSVLSKMTYNPGQNSWTLEGDVYVLH